MAGVDLSASYRSVMDTVIREMEADGGLETTPRLSSGLLVVDLIHGGGLGYGISVLVGLEASGKTTLGMCCLAQALKVNTPIAEMFDGENTLNPVYSGRILKIMSGFNGEPSSLFGVRAKDGRWKVPPRLDYSDANTHEAVFRTVHKVLSALPDKRYRDGQPYLVFGRDREQMDLYKSMGLKADKTMSTKKIWCPVDDHAPQAFFLLDSLNCLVPQDVDDEEVTGDAMALNARMFGRYLPLISGKMRRKACVFVATNQIRTSPGVRYGSPEYEAGGNAPKQYSSIRLRLDSRVPPDGFDRDKESPQLCIEPSVVPGGRDLYAFKAFRNYKNKWGVPYRKGMGRVWVSDHQGRAYGFDPVYDAFQFFDMLGVIQKERGREGRFRIVSTEPSLKALQGHAFTWETWKLLVLAEAFRDRTLAGQVEQKGLPKVAIRKLGFTMLGNGVAEQLFQAVQQKGGGNDEE